MQKPVEMIDLKFYSPVEMINYHKFENKGCQVHVKRDDLIHPFISGNKWRKLKYTLRQAKKENKMHLVTFGGAWSNHLLATAAASAKFGFSSTAYIRGEKVANANLDLCELFGMQLIFTDRNTYKDKQLIFEKHHKEDPNTYFIDEGGTSIHALEGCAEIIDELSDEYDHIFCASGTGTTLVGLHKGIKRNKKHTKLHGVPVLAGGSFLYEEMKSLDPDCKDILLHTEYHFGGYAKTKPPLIDFIKDFVSCTGILIEPVYTGKVMFCVIDLIEKGYFNPGTKILVLHTGGLMGILGKLSLFDKKQNQY